MREDAAYWGLTDREEINYLDRLTADRRRRIHALEAEAARYGRLAARFRRAALIVLAVTAVLLALGHTR